MPGLHPANSTLTSTNTGLADGTLYCLVMSANSSQISVRLASSVSGQINFTRAGNPFKLNRPAAHTGWVLPSQTNSVAGTDWVNVDGSL